VRELIDGTRGVSVRTWEVSDPVALVVIVHGYGEHIDRYAHVARALARRSAVVLGPDHVGHGRSEGERALVDDFDAVVEDLHRVLMWGRGRWPGVPVAMIGHSMGGLIAIRYTQRHPGELAGLVISGPAVGLAPVFETWLADPVPPSDPIDPAVLSRDPAVGEAYDADPLVYRGGWKRPTLEAFVAADRAIADGPGFGPLPVLYVHGGDDQLVPLALAQPAVRRLAGADFTETVLPGARHEVFNELDRETTIALAAEFIGRVTS
jgi:alpha-beta hydrolase superfamily lysophospholipase